MLFLKTALILLISLGIVSFSVLDTTDDAAKPIHIDGSGADSLALGKQLALRHCSGCHLFPQPDLLDKKTWVVGVLPNMAMRLGLRLPGQDTLRPVSLEEEQAVRQLNVYPETPQLSLADWQHIVHYYEQTAPAEPLPQPAHKSIQTGLSLFRATGVMLGDKPAPQTTLLKYNKNTAQLYVGDTQNTVSVVDGQFRVTDTWLVDTPPTDIDFPQQAAPRLLTVGVFSPSDQHLGRLMSLTRTSKSGSLPLNIKTLPRPVQFAAGDLNADGNEDVVICGFGNHAGKLFWYDNFNPAKEHVLKAMPGARKVEIVDMNRDKKPDIVVLMAQAREEVAIFYNQGNGRFREKVVLRFPPVFGGSYVELADFNRDGSPDILLTNGDNWDYSAVDKNYHGIRIFLNDKKDNFTEAWFYPMFGASKAVARDFDGDGDLDIAATSFYANLTRPEESFVYFSNEGRLNFTPFSTPEAASGKWLTMETADFDSDGDLDIVLGSYFHTMGEMTQLLVKGITTFPQLLVLENGHKKNP